MSIEQRLAVWNIEHNMLEKDFDKLTDLWLINKNCNCNSDADGIFCKHYDNIINATLGHKADKLWEDRLQISIEALEKAMKN